MPKTPKCMTMGILESMATMSMSIRLMWRKPTSILIERVKVKDHGP